MKADEMREKSLDELTALLLENRQKQFNMRMQRGSGQPPRPSEFGGTRREIARIKTVMAEKNRTGGDSK